MTHTTELSFHVSLFEPFKTLNFWSDAQPTVLTKFALYINSYIGDIFSFKAFTFFQDNEMQLVGSKETHCIEIVFLGD